MSSRPMLSDEVIAALRNAAQHASYMAPAISAARDAVASYAQLLGPQIQQIQDAIVAAMSVYSTSIIDVQSRFTNTLDALYPSISALANTFSQLNMPDVIASWEEGASVDIANESGFDFLEDAVKRQFSSSLVYTDSRVVAALLTSKMLAHTKQPEFLTLLDDSFASSKLLARRRPIITVAMDAHRSRTYLASVPLFMSQLEGAVGDLLVSQSIAISSNGKLFESPLLSTAPMGKRKEFRGFASKVQTSPFSSHAALTPVRDHIINSVAPKRNQVLHGTSFDHGTAQQSTQLVLLLAIVMGVQAAFERGTPP